MPVVFHQNIDPLVSVAVWRITETEEDLFNTILLTNSDMEALRAFTLPKRRLERLACRHALAFLWQTDRVELDYSAIGAPKSAKGFVSLSHSGMYAAAAFSATTPVGLDLEKISDRTARLYDRFMPPNSPPLPEKAAIPHLPTYIWCAKEAAYKLYAQGDIDFVHAITIEPEHQCGTVALPQGGSLPFAVFYAVVEDMMLCVAK
jgi:phosphopantetheinyl transferase